MVNPKLFHEILRLTNIRKGRLMDLAQAALPEHQFQAFKKLLFDELGDRGLDGEIKALFKKQHGMEWNGRE